MTEPGVVVDPRARRQARRTALLLGVFAIALYLSFILYALRHGHA